MKIISYTQRTYLHDINNVESYVGYKMYYSADYCYKIENSRAYRGDVTLRSFRCYTPTDSISSYSSQCSGERCSMSCDRSYSSILNTLRPVRPNKTYPQLSMLYRPYTTTKTMLTLSTVSNKKSVRGYMTFKTIYRYERTTFSNDMASYYVMEIPSNYLRHNSEISIPEATSLIDSLINDIFQIYTHTSMISITLSRDQKQSLFELKLYNDTNIEFDNLFCIYSKLIEIDTLMNLILNKMNRDSFSKNYYSQNESSIDDCNDVLVSKDNQII